MLLGLLLAFFQLKLAVVDETAANNALSAEEITALLLQKKVTPKKEKKNSGSPVGTTLYGTASFYASKFQGRKTASGEIFDHKKMTAACNALPLGTWIRVTNLKNKKSILVKTNDRLAAKSSRLVDLTTTAARQLGFISSGLTRVKVEVVPKATVKNKN